MSKSQSKVHSSASKLAGSKNFVLAKKKEKADKKSKKQQWTEQAHFRNRSRCQNRDLKDRLVNNDYEHVLANEVVGGGGVVTLTEADLDLIKPSKSAGNVLDLIARRLGDKRSWTDNCITFLCCVKFRRILSRDTGRYICQKFLMPQTFLVDCDAEGMVKLMRGQEVSLFSPPPIAFSPICKSFDAAEKELWFWGSKKGEIFVLDLRKDAWRAITNQKLLDHHEAVLEEMTRPYLPKIVLEMVWCGDVLYAHTIPPNSHYEVAFSCCNKQRTLKQLPARETLRKKRYSFQFAQTIVKRDFIFSFMSSDNCYEFPKVYEQESCCWYCGGRDWTRPAKACNCCVSLQVLLAKDDIFFGWTMLDVPPIHFGVAPKFHIRGSTLICAGGSERPLEGLHSRNPGPEVVFPVESGEWRLNLLNPDSRWVHFDETSFVEDGFVIEM